MAAGRHLLRSRCGIAGCLELLELILRRLSGFGVRERAATGPVGCVLALDHPVLLAFGGFLLRATGRKEPPNEIPDTHIPHLKTLAV
jgi:hypothetical protein